MKRHDLFEFYSPATRRTGRAAAAGCEGSFKGSIGHNVWVCGCVLVCWVEWRGGGRGRFGDQGNVAARTRGGGLGVTVPEPLRPWVMRRVFAQRAWASYEFLSFHGNVTESPPSRMFVRAGTPNPLVPLLFSHVYGGFFFFFSNFYSISYRGCATQPDNNNREFTKTKQKTVSESR